MEDPQGRVISVRPSGAGGYAMVEIAGVVACQRCASGKGCGAGLFAGDSPNKLVTASVATDIDLSDGDIVRVALQPSSVLRAAIIVYGYPLAGAMLGAAAALGFGLSDGGGVLATLVGLVCGWFAARAALRSRSCLRKFTPVVTEKLPSSAAD